MTETIIPRLAATILLVRDGASGLEVFMVKRHHAIDFASGALVFPGGKVEVEDSELAVETDGASRVAALRETFEECGVLLARPRGGRPLVDGPRCAAIRAAVEQRPFGRMLADENLELAFDALTPFAHWITPPILPKRFDTRFYIAAAPEDQMARHDGTESVDSLWVNPARALADAEGGRHTLVLATKLNLRMLGESANVADAIAAARARKIVAVEPVATKTDSGYLRSRSEIATSHAFLAPGSKSRYIR
jgi:8-oxo-dGTP pyrophosphatase MutT (NUDIX family)